jgi:hypothetical protein
MTLFKDTIVGKLLGKVGSVVLPIVSNIPVIGGIAAGATKIVGGLVGNLGKQGTASAPTTLSNIAANAKALLTGVTAQQNTALAEQQTQLATDQNNLKVFNQLVAGGMSREQALAASGLGQTSSGSLISVGSPNWLIWIGVAVGGFALLKVLKIIK